MKKIFSAFLLMTMMVASVGSFVSCSDIEESIAAVDEATKDNAASIKDLEGKIAALQTALQTAQSEAAAAKAEANAAKQAAATAKAEAIAAALAEIEKVNGDVDAVNAEIKKINDALAGCATKEAVELLQATIDEYKAITDENAEAIAALEEALAALGENVTPEQLAEVVAKMTAIDEALVAFQNRLQSVSYVPEWKDGPTAVLFEENEEYGYVHMSYEVAPAAYASKITAENTKLVGVALKGVEVEEHDVKILSADPETGIVEVIAYIGVDSKVWEAKADANGKAVAAVALRVVAEDAQFTSAYTNVNVLGGDKAAESINDYVFFGTYNEDDEFVTNVYDEEKKAYQPVTLTHTVSYDTPVADSEVALFEGLVARVNVPGFFEYVPVEEAAEMFGIEIKVTEKLSSFATKYFVTTVTEYNWVEDDDDEPETPAFIVAKDQTLDITVKFNEVVVDSLKKAETLPSYKTAGASAALKAGYFQVNGEKAATFAGLTAVYDVVGPEKNLELVLNNNEAINVEWTPKNYSERATLKIEDLDVTGGDARMLDKKITFDYTPLDKDGEPMAKSEAPAVTVDFISIDNADVTIDLTEWPVKATTYTYAFEGNYTDENDTKVIVTFDVTFAVEAAPEAIGEVPVVDSLAVTLVKSGEKVEDPTKVKTEIPFNGVVEKLLPYYKSYYKTEKEAKAEIAKAIETKTVRIYVVDTATGEMPETAQYQAVYTYKHETGKAEDSKITIPYNATTYAAMSEKYVRFAFDVDIFGVKSTVIADCAKVAKWVPFTAPSAKVVEGRLSGKFNGKQTYVLGSKTNTVEKTVNGEQVVDYTYTYDVAPTTAATAYEYNKTKTFSFKDYVDFDIHTDDQNVYYVVWQVKPQAGVTHTGSGTAADPHVLNTTIPVLSVASTNFAIKPGTAATDPTTVVNDKFDASNYPIKGWSQPYKLIGTGNDRAAFDAITLNWNNSEVASYKVDFKLVTYNATEAKYVDVAGSAKTIEFKTDRAISSVTTNEVVIDWSNDASKMIKNVMTAVTVKDLFNTVINNQGADVNLTNFWSGYSLDQAATEAATNTTHTPVYKTDSSVPGTASVYGQTISIVEFDIDDVATTETMGIIKAPKGYTAADYTFTETTGEFKFHPNTAPAQDVEFTVYVEVTHGNDYAQQGLKKAITIKINVE